MVAGVAIKKREERAPGCRVNNLVDARERKRVFRAVLVEICVIDTVEEIKNGGPWITVKGLVATSTTNQSLFLEGKHKN